MALAMLLPACSASADDATDGLGHEALEAAREAGRRDAESALSQPENSMKRENAVLAIRARETELRTKGYVHCADAYVEAAAGILFPADSAATNSSQPCMPK